jgi:hypothetical protein
VRLAGLAILVATSGCAATHAAVAVARSQRALDRADAADVADAAVYERTMAEAHLEEARAQASLSSYRSAVDLARTAETWATRAAEAAAKSPAPQAPAGGP